MCQKSISWRQFCAALQLHNFFNLGFWWDSKDLKIMSWCPFRYKNCVSSSLTLPLQCLLSTRCQLSLICHSKNRQDSLESWHSPKIHDNWLESWLDPKNRENSLESWLPSKNHHNSLESLLWPKNRDNSLESRLSPALHTREPKDEMHEKCTRLSTAFAGSRAKNE